MTTKKTRNRARKDEDSYAGQNLSVQAGDQVLTRWGMSPWTVDKVYPRGSIVITQIRTVISRTGTVDRMYQEAVTNQDIWPTSEETS